MPPEVLVAESSPSRYVNNETRTREIWIGNLDSTITESVLYRHFFIYGEIERIDTFSFKGFAFIRFCQTSAATRAADNGNLLIEGRNLRIALSNRIKRTDSLGDKPGYDPARNAKTLRIEYARPGPIQIEGVQEVMNRYGRVKALYVKQMHPESMYRSHMFVDYETHEEAENALFHLYENDKGGLRRKELGDENIEVCYAYKRLEEIDGKGKIDPKMLCIV